jgi:hypothetical protein
MVTGRSFVAAVLLALSTMACEMVAGIGDRKAGTTVQAQDSGAGGGAGHADATSDSGMLPGGAGGGVQAGTGGMAAAGDAGVALGDGGAGNAAGLGGTVLVGGATGGTTGQGGVPSDAGSTGGTTGVRDAAPDVPLCTPTPTPGTGSGLQGDYFVTPTLTGFQLSRTDPRIDFSWDGAPDVGLPADGFSVRWTGQVEPLYTGLYTFYTTADDGVRVWVNGTLLIDDWNSHSPTESSGVASLVGGQKYDIKIEYFENTGTASIQLAWSSACQKREIVPASQLYAPVATCGTASVGTGTGLAGNYYDNADLTALRLTRTDATVAFAWPDGTSPADTIAPGSFSVRWTGQIQATYTGWTTLYVASDDGVRLFIDDTMVIDDWTSHARTESAATFNWVAGQKHNLRLEYNEESGGGLVQLLWGGACQAKDIVPQTQLYPSYTGVDCSQPVLGKGSGLTGDYYDNSDFTNRVASHPAEVVSFDWGAGAPAPGMGADNFSIRWTGKVLAPFTGATNFVTSSDDGARLWLDGQLVIDDWTAHQVHETAGVVSLVAGQLYDLKLEYREDLEMASISLGWSSTCQPKQVIPASQLYPSSPPEVDAGPDGGPDAGPDAAPDAGPDAAPDVAPPEPDVALSPDTEAPPVDASVDTQPEPAANQRR